MFYKHVYSQQPSYLMELKCNFHFMPVCTFKICDLTVAMIDKTSSGFDLCHHTNSLPSTLILYRPIRMHVKCVIDIT